MPSRQRPRHRPPDDLSDDSLDAYFEDELILQDYISRLLTLQDEREAFLDKEDLKTTAQDLGLTDEDLEKIETLVEAHRKRGANYARYNRWDEAVEEYRQAVTLDPFDKELVLGLAKAHQGRWQKLGHAADREEAARYARRAIELDADYSEAFRLLEELDRQPIRATAGTPPSQAKVRLSMALLFGSMVLVLVLVAALFLWIF